MSATKEPIWDALRELDAIFRKHADSGVSDTEGRYKVKLWLRRKLENQPSPRMTYKYLECFEDWTGDRRAVVRDVSAAARTLLRVLTRAKRAGVIQSVDEVM